jgi:hypothetical protein
VRNRRRQISVDVERIKQLKAALSEVLGSRITEEATSAFCELVNLGCDPCTLLMCVAYLVEPARRADKSEKLMGFHPKALKTVVKRMRQSAEDIERILGSQVGRLYLLVHAPGLRSLPSDLRLLASGVGDSARTIKPGTHLNRRVAIGMLVSNVMGTTGSPYDRQVSALISAAEDRDDYDEVGQRVWRGDNTDLIDALSSNSTT